MPFTNTLNPSPSMGIMPKCPTCGRDDFSREQDMKTHHKLTHGESLARAEYECAYCGATLERLKCENEHKDRVYCDLECSGKHQSELPAHEQPNWQGGPVTVECSICGTPKEMRRAAADKTENPVCSIECFAELKSRVSGKDHHQYKRVKVECDWCGEPTYKIPARVERSENDFCSYECHNRWMAEYQHGPNHHQWKGGRAAYGPGWHESKREAVRERDGRECRLCDLSEAESIEWVGRKLDVHHLIDPKESTNPAVYNAKRNLVTLCVSCHHHVESYPDRGREVLKN